MRALSAVLLFCVLALGMSGRLMAAEATEITTANAQLLVNTAKAATTGVYTDVKLTINGMEVVFAVFRDAVGVARRAISAVPPCQSRLAITGVPPPPSSR